MKREINPPMILSMDDSDDNEEIKYLKQMERVKFRDEDYKEENQTLNRVRQFTFVRDNFE
jgi:hypothetical protein